MPLNLSAIKSRLIISFFANAFRAGIIFSAGILVARGLGPNGYGDLAFLIGSFAAVRALLDMGSSSAFFTFLSKQSRGNRFYRFYLLWLTLQFLITILCVALIIPSDLFEKIWLGHSRQIVLLTFIAVFMQQQVWQMVVQIGESARKTLKIHTINIVVALTYLLSVWLLIILESINIEAILWSTTCIYMIAIAYGYHSLNARNSTINQKDTSYQLIFREFLTYCKPLMGMAVAGFLYSFADKWILQKFGGAAQQGYFQIASQFAQVSLLANIAILNIFWKEIAEANGQGDHERVARIYQKMSRGLVLFSATIAGLLIPWSKQIVSILLGPSYMEAWPVLAIMLLYPIHQSMGQIGGTMFLARGDTKKYVILSTIFMLVSLPLSYFAMAPSYGTWIPGLGLGAFGMACYMVLSSVIGVNIQAWVIAQDGGWKFDWLYQLLGIPLMIAIGYLAKIAVGMIWDVNNLNISRLLMPVIVSFIIYVFLVVLVLWLQPWLAGLDKTEMRNWLNKVLKGGQLGIH